jgi:tripartite-type tricarboxylate transporter receptor subunit TctC
LNHYYKNRDSQSHSTPWHQAFRRPALARGAEPARTNSPVKKLGRATLLALACFLPWLSSSVQAQGSAANYPNRPVRFIVPYSPGGLGDTFARVVAEQLSQRLGQPVIVEDMPGASQAIGAAAAAKAPPDGYTIFMGTQSGLVLNTIARKKLPYDPVKDFAPVSMLFYTPLFLVVHPSVKANSVQELIALAKANPGRLTVASIGAGTSTHLAAEMFQTRTGTQLLHVPYKGSSQAITDVLAGQVNMMFEGGASALPYVRKGQLRALASSGTKRSEEAIRNLPIMAETLPGFDFSVWFGIVAPAGVPRPIIDRLNKEISEIMKTPKTKDLAVTLGADIQTSTPEEMGARIRTDLQQFTKIMRDAGIEPQ